jgi:hypothetical protein
LPPSRGVARDAARLAVVDVAVELAQDEQVDARDDLGLERRGRQQLGEQERRPVVGEKRELAPQAQQAVARAAVERQQLLAGLARRAEEDGIGLARRGERLRRQRVARCRDGRGADRRMRELERSALADFLQHLHRLCGDLRADAVAAHHQDLHAR